MKINKENGSLLGVVITLLIVAAFLHFVFKNQDETPDREGKIVSIDEYSVGIDTDNNNVANFKTNLNNTQLAWLIHADKTIDLSVMYDKDKKVIDFLFDISFIQKDVFYTDSMIASYHWKR